MLSKYTDFSRRKRHTLYGKLTLLAQVITLLPKERIINTIREHETDKHNKGTVSGINSSV